jgi:hypothetical protein
MIVETLQTQTLVFAKYDGLSTSALTTVNTKTIVSDKYDGLLLKMFLYFKLTLGNYHDARITLVLC